METKCEENFASLKIPVNQWEEICNIIETGKDYKKLDLGNGMQFRFTPMEDNTCSACLSLGPLDMFHFMWTEVDGVVNLTHRIVHPLHRGRGVATEMMRALEIRVEHLSDQMKRPFLFMIETSQVSVCNLALKRGLKITQGKNIYENLAKYNIDANTYISNDNGYRLFLRLSKLIKPV